MIDDRTNPQANASPTARQRAIDAYEDARDRAADTFSEAPLIALAGGLAAGALIAALLPRTRTEARLVKPTARRVRDSASAAYKAARDTGKQRFDDLGFTRQKGRETLDSFIEGLRDTAKASADAALEAARKG